jgi:hypothetical protein
MKSTFTLLSLLAASSLATAADPGTVTADTPAPKVSLWDNLWGSGDSSSSLLYDGKVSEVPCHLY